MCRSPLRLLISLLNPHSVISLSLPLHHLHAVLDHFLPRQNSRSFRDKPLRLSSGQFSRETDEGSPTIPAAESDHFFGNPNVTFAFHLTKCAHPISRHKSISPVMSLEFRPVSVWCPAEARMQPKRFSLSLSLNLSRRRMLRMMPNKP